MITNTYEKIVLTHDKEKLKQYWDIATGLNKVDNLTPSKYMESLIRENIDGNIEIEDIEKSLHKYYKKFDTISKEIAAERECDFVSKRIVDFLHSKSFTFSPVMLKTIHKRLFENLNIIDDKYVGTFRDYNISKKEKILAGDTVIYGDYANFIDLFEYDFTNERKYRYQYPLKDAEIENISAFTSSIWQSHPFVEGNTRTVALFMLMYFYSKGFDVYYDLFKENSLFFRNALVRSNYENIKANIYKTNKFLNDFYENLLLGKNIELSNKNLDISKKIASRQSS